MYDPNQAPAPGGVDIDAQMRQTQRTPIISVAAALGASAGLFAIIMALQLFDLFRLRGGWKWVPYLFLVYGSVSFGLGVRLFRQRVWAATASTVMHSLAGLGTGFWLLLVASSGFVSFAGLIVPPLALGAGVCSGIAISQCVRTREAQARLAKAGMDVDF